MLDVDPAVIVEERRFSLCNVDGRNNKFWNIALLRDGAVVVHWGPQGKTGTKKTFPCGHAKAGRQGFLKLIREKTSSSHQNGAYTENKVLDTGTTTILHSKSNLHAVAVREIARGNTELEKLVQYFTDVNIHNIAHASGGKITYDQNSGMFKTTQGIITREQIEEARKLLNNIAAMTAHGVYSGREFFELVNPYLSLIPQQGLIRQMNFQEMFGFTGLRKQGDILDGLEASYSAVLNAPSQNDQKSGVFKVNLSVLPPGDEWNAVRKAYISQKGEHFDSKSLDVKQIFNLRIESMSLAFLKCGVKLGNVVRLWHGTKASNVLSILQGGMSIPPRADPHVTARMFGDGIYFSNVSTKAIRYATGKWGKAVGVTSRVFMFWADVAMGKPYYPSGPIQRIPGGYNSCYAKGHTGIKTLGGGELLNDEMIVYQANQVNPVYLVEFI